MKKNIIKASRASLYLVIFFGMFSGTFALQINSTSPDIYQAVDSINVTTKNPVILLQPPSAGWYVFFATSSATTSYKLFQVNAFNITNGVTNCNNTSIAGCNVSSLYFRRVLTSPTFTTTIGTTTYNSFPFYFEQSGGQKYLLEFRESGGSGVPGTGYNFKFIMAENTGTVQGFVKSDSGYGDQSVSVCGGSTCNGLLSPAYFLNTTLAKSATSSVESAMTSGDGYWSGDFFNNPEFQAEFASTSLLFTFGSTSLDSFRPSYESCDPLSPTSYSGCIVNAMIDVFYPSYDALNTVQTAKENLFTKVPFGYATLIYEPFSVDLRDPAKATLANVVLTERLGNATRTITIIDWSHMTDFLTSPIMALVNQLAIAGIYLGFCFWAFKHITKKAHI